MSLAVVLCLESRDDASVVFSIVFLVVWGGSAVVTLNAQLLGARISFFQTVCLLGYCLFPLLLSAGFCVLWNAVLSPSLAVALRFASVAFAALWSIFAAASFLSDDEVPDGKLGLILYPAALFFLTLAWMVLMGFQQKAPPMVQPPVAVPTPTPNPSGSLPSRSLLF
mmetsp:Transcript_3472/g.9497  ORF Transcript_3472/g.9497 Transcript_3472/m.9497 type:complete len:167 (+) Transcript_3472:310-810(+)